MFSHLHAKLPTIFLALTLLAASLMLTSAPARAAEDPTSVRMETEPASGQVGASFTTRLYADNIPTAGLGSWQVQLDYDAGRLALESIEFGTDLYSTGRSKLIEVSSTDTPGQVLLVQASLPGPTGPSGSGIHLATLHWRGIGPGAASLTLTPAAMQKLKDSNGDPITPLELTSNEIFVGFADASLWLPMLMR